MPQLEIRTLVRGRVELRAKEGSRLLARDNLPDRAKDKDVRRFAAQISVEPTWLHSALEAHWGDGTREVGYTSNHELPSPPPVGVMLRGLTQQACEGRMITGPRWEDVIRLALETRDYPAPQPAIMWEGSAGACCVDMDFHATPDFERRPDEARLGSFIDRVIPRPRIAWSTHGRGVRLVYFATDSFAASELAAVGAVRLSQIEPSATFELKTSTRHPAYPNNKGRICGPVRWFIQTEDVSAIIPWFDGGVDISKDEVQAWLEGRGLEVGKRYDHERCPVEPHRPSHAEPVQVYDNGILCYACQGHGVRRGSRAPGWFPYATFVGRPGGSVIKNCVEHFTHWEHARFVLAAHYGGSLSESILRGAYGACLRNMHPNDLRIASVFTAGKDVVRYERYWGTTSGEAYKAQTFRDSLAELPACRRVEDGETKRDTDKVSRFSQSTDLRAYGYPHLERVWGMRIYGERLEATYPYTILLQRSEGRPPRYIPERDRASEEAAWLRIQEAFPGVNRNAIKLLIAAKGCAEADGTFAPFVFITGVTSSAKSTSVVLAAAMCGDRAHSVPCVSNDERIRAAISEAKSNGSYVVFNEAVKDAYKAKTSPVQAMEFALSLTPDSVSHKLYTGPVEMGALPVCVWTDTDLPADLRRHAQLARRIVHVYLPGSVDWHKSMLETGMKKAERLRCHEPEYADAADVIVSGVIDQFFSQPLTFEQIANALGFHTLKDSEVALESTEELLRFYELVMKLPTWERDIRFRCFDMDSEAPVAKLWKELADGPDHKTSQRCSEVDWQKLLKNPRPVRFHVVNWGKKIRICFEGVIRDSNGTTSDPQPDGGRNIPEIPADLNGVLDMAGM